MDPGRCVEGPLIDAVISIDEWSSCEVGVEPTWISLTLGAAVGGSRSVSEATATVLSVGEGTGDFGAVVATDVWSSCAVGAEPAWLSLTLGAAVGGSRSVTEATAALSSIGEGASVVGAINAIEGWSSCAVGVEPAWLSFTHGAAVGVTRSVREATAPVLSMGEGTGVNGAVFAIDGWSSCAGGVEPAWLSFTHGAAVGVSRSVSEATATVRSIGEGASVVGAVIVIDG